jgi:outer membrane protein TolC
MSRSSRLAGAILAVWLAGQGPALAQAVTPAPLSPEELLRAVSQAMPVLARARQGVRVAEGNALEARGAFDMKLKAEGLGVRGFYDNNRLKATVEQPLAALGLNTFSGYRTGRGTFAPYDAKAQTLSEGELTAGFSLPLLRGRAIDARRADRQVADLGVAAAERDLDTTRLSLSRDALFEYWDWVASGTQLRVAEALLAIAELRDQQLADAVALGQIAPVERTDNRRAILQRRSALASARRLLEQQTIDLSLYLRDAAGQPLRPSLERLPALAPAATLPDLREDAAVQEALARRPELQSVRVEQRQEQVRLQQALNETLPDVELFSQVSSDYGTGAPSRAGSALEAGVSFELPFQRRKAEGKSLQSRAKLAALDEKRRWAEDRVRADVQDALSAVAAARDVAQAVREELDVARELEGLERDRFALGDSTQFMVNLRELATADAALREARALADLQKALVQVEAATGRLADRLP